MTTQAVTFTRNPYIQPTQADSSDRRREAAQNVAAGTGAYGAGAAVVSKKGVTTSIKKAMGSISGTIEATQQNAKEVSTLWGKFQNDVKRFSTSIMYRLSKFKDTKYIGVILKNPAVKIAAHGCGAVMAFFALVSGVSHALETGKIAAGDFKDRLNALA